MCKNSWNDCVEEVITQWEQVKVSRISRNFLQCPDTFGYSLPSRTFLKRVALAFTASSYPSHFSVIPNPLSLFVDVSD